MLVSLCLEASYSRFLIRDSVRGHFRRSIDRRTKSFDLGKSNLSESVRTFLVSGSKTLECPEAITDMMDLCCRQKRYDAAFHPFGDIVQAMEVTHKGIRLVNE